MEKVVANTQSGIGETNDTNKLEDHIIKSSVANLLESKQNQNDDKLKEKIKELGFGELMGSLLEKIKIINDLISYIGNDAIEKQVITKILLVGNNLKSAMEFRDNGCELAFSLKNLEGDSYFYIACKNNKDILLKELTCENEGHIYEELAIYLEKNYFK